MPPTPRKFAQGISDFEDDAATVTQSGHELKLAFVGAPAGTEPCDASYTLTAASTTHAVALMIIAHPVSTHATCSLVGYRRTVTVHLDTPLGGRVLIDGTNGGPIAAVVVW